VRHDLFQNFQFLGGELGEQHRHPSDISAGPREARNVPDADGIGMGGEYNGDRFSRPSCGLDHCRRHGEDHIDIHPHEFGCELGQLLDAFHPAEAKDNVLPLDVTEVAQAPLQRVHPARPCRSGPEIQKPDLSDFCRLLPARGERPCGCRAAEKRDERAPFHVGHGGNPLPHCAEPYSVTGQGAQSVCRI
jgi:hypothetical protein